MDTGEDTPQTARDCFLETVGEAFLCEMIRNLQAVAYEARRSMQKSVSREQVGLTTGNFRYALSQDVMVQIGKRLRIARSRLIKSGLHHHAQLDFVGKHPVTMTFAKVGSASAPLPHANYRQELWTGQGSLPFPGMPIQAHGNRFYVVVAYCLDGDKVDVVRIDFIGRDGKTYEQLRLDRMFPQEFRNVSEDSLSPNKESTSHDQPVLSSGSQKVNHIPVPEVPKIREEARARQDAKRERSKRAE
ncbi:MAG: hypothetical protein ACREP2_13310 [Rhodanobacteraceae bacterium]